MHTFNLQFNLHTTNPTYLPLHLFILPIILFPLKPSSAPGRETTPEKQTQKATILSLQRPGSWQ